LPDEGKRRTLSSRWNKEENMEIGFIGLGIMGSRMAANLLKNGYHLTVHNRTPEKAEPLLKKGAAWAENPASLAGGADILFTILANPEAVQETALGPAGFLDTMQPGAIWVDSSTVNPSFTKKMAQEAHKRQVHFLDAPVAGTKGPAEQAQLIFLVGGEAQDVQTCQPLFDAMGKKVIHLGSNGMGTSAKMVVNLMLGEAMLAFSEALALGQSLDIPMEGLMNLLVGGPVAAPFTAGKRAKIENSQYEPEFPLKWMRKDLQLVSLTGYEQGVALPTVNAAKEIYTLAERLGWGEQDFSAIYDFLTKQDHG
jgi:3-hydroxyisobutyrate dehydrogenase-like beta-hydroxyacid dehydrogenase